MSIDQNNQLTNIQNQIKQIAQNLALINLQQNNILLECDRVSHQIFNIKRKRQIKKKQIQQQANDKILIHSKLIAAQKKKQVLQKKMMAKKFQTQKNKLKQESVAHMHKPNLQKQANIKQTINSEEVKNIKQTVNDYKNQEKGNYQPPLLFFIQEPQIAHNKFKQQNSDSINQDQILERIRKNFSIQQ